MIRAAAPLLVVALALSACQTTQELSAQRARSAKKLVNQKGLTVSHENPDVAVGATNIVHDANGIAAVVELRNTGKVAQANLPIAIAVTDAHGKAVYRNDVGGLEDSLVSMSLLGKGEDAFWVNNQITATGTPAKVQARVGAGQGQGARAAADASPSRASRCNPTAAASSPRAPSSTARRSSRSA